MRRLFRLQTWGGEEAGGGRGEEKERKIGNTEMEILGVVNVAENAVRSGEARSGPSSEPRLGAGPAQCRTAGGAGKRTGPECGAGGTALLGGVWLSRGRAR